MVNLSSSMLQAAGAHYNSLSLYCIVWLLTRFVATIQTHLPGVPVVVAQWFLSMKLT